MQFMTRWAHLFFSIDVMLVVSRLPPLPFSYVNLVMSFFSASEVAIEIRDLQPRSPS